MLCFTEGLFILHWHFLISSYLFTVSNELSLECRKGGLNFKIYPTCMFQMSSHWLGGLILRFTPVNLKICLWYLYVYSMHWYFLISSYYLTVSNGCSLTALKSVEFTQCSGSFEGGVNLKIYPGKSENLPLVSTCFLYALVGPYIFLWFDCFEWALIDCIEKCRVYSVLWQFWLGG